MGHILNNYGIQKFMNVNILSPMLVKETNKLVFMDFNDTKVYELKIKDSSLFLEEIDTKTSNGCFEDVEQQQILMSPEIPLEQIAEVMSTEKSLSDQNTKHIFRRNS